MKIHHIGLALLVVTASTAIAAEPDYLGVSNSSPLTEIALLRGISNITSGNILKWSSGFRASIISVTAEDKANQSLKEKLFGTRGDVYVRPGSYVVRVQCHGAGFKITQDFPPISVDPGYAYLLECFGTTAHNMRTRVNKQPIAEVDKAHVP